MLTDFEEKLELAKELIAKREDITRQLAELFGGAPAVPKPERACSKCGQTGHTARKCESSNPAGEAPRML